MRGTQLYTLIKKLEPKVQEDFKNWLLWRLRGKELYLLILYEQLLKRPDWTLVWQSMFPQKPLPQNSKQIPHILRKRAHALKKLLKEYLAYQYILEDQYFLDLSFLRSINEGKINEDFMLFFRQVERAYTQKDGDYHEQMGLMLKVFYEYEFKTGKKKIGSRWQEMLDHFAIANRFRFLELYLSTTNNRRLPVSIKKPKDFSLKKLAKDKFVLANPALQLLLSVCRLMDKEVEKAPGEHLQVIEAYKENYPYFEIYMQQNMSICIENYLNRLILDQDVQGDPIKNSQNRIDRFSYYLWAAEEGLSLYEGLLPIKRYVNIVAAGIEADRLSQARAFMEAFSLKLDPKLRDDIYRFCEGLCLFEEGKYDKILKGFLRTSFPTPIYEANGRLLHLQARYEKGERAELEVPLRSLVAYCTRNPALSEGFKKQSKLKIKLFLLLLTSFRREKVLKMKEQAQQIQNPSYRKWMNNKIEQRLDGKEFLPLPL